MELKDAFVIVHAEEIPLNQKKSDFEKKVYEFGISKRVGEYLSEGKYVFFTRVNHHFEDIGYLHQYFDDIIWLTKDDFPTSEIQGKKLKQYFLSNNLSEIEIAGGFEFACFKATISSILDENYSIKSHSEITYQSKKNGKIILYASKKNIF